MSEMEMPKYKCHKEVWALRIAFIEYENKGEGAAITPVEDGYEPFAVSSRYLNKHNPEVGDYYVVYEDGYRSCSPAAVFESGYSLIDQNRPMIELTTEEAIEILKHISRDEGFIIAKDYQSEVLGQFDFSVNILTEKLKDD